MPGVHDRDLVAHPPHHVQVVRDHEQAHPALALEIEEEVQDLGLHRDVERRGRLVADHELGIERERPGDPDPLALPARELGRVGGRRRCRPSRRSRAARGCARRARPRATPWMSSGSATTSPTVNRPSIDSYGSWKIIPIALRAVRSARAERPYGVPLKRSAPSLGRSRPTISRAVVDLPHPDSPTTPSVRPACELERHGVDGGHAPEPLRHPVELDDRGAHRAPPRRWHAAWWPGPTSTVTGTMSGHGSWTCAQRG